MQRSWMRHLLVAGLVGLIIVAMGALAYYAVPRAPPQLITTARISITRGRIIRFARSYGRLPPDLASLPEMQGLDPRRLGKRLLLLRRPGRPGDPDELRE